jgi:hypothetical protein
VRVRVRVRGVCMRGVCVRGVCLRCAAVREGGNYHASCTEIFSESDESCFSAHIFQFRSSK